MEGGGEVCAILLWDIVVSVLKFQVKLSMKITLKFCEFFLLIFMKFHPKFQGHFRYFEISIRGLSHFFSCLINKSGISDHQTAVHVILKLYETLWNYLKLLETYV